MATIKTAIQLYNGMSPALQSMNAALNMVITSFETMQNASSRAVDIRSLQAARAELNKAETAFNAIEKEIREADQAQQRSPPARSLAKNTIDPPIAGAPP